MYRLSVQATTSYDALLREAMEDKLYYHQDTCSPVEFSDLVEAEIKLLKARSAEKPEITFRDLLRSLKKKIHQIFH